MVAEVNGETLTSNQTETGNADEVPSERLSILKVPVDVIPDSALDDRVWNLLEEGGGKNIVLLSTADLLRARRGKEYRPYVANAALVLPVSHGVRRGCKFLRKKTPECYIPFDLVVRILTVLEQKEATVFLLGGNDHTLRVTEPKIRETFPGLRIVGRYPGYFKKSGEPLILEAIRKAAPSLLLVAHGVRGGEKWIARNDSKLNPGMRLWCSDLFEVFAGKKQRPSRFLFHHGLEWFSYFLRRPSRIFRFFPWLWYNLLLLVYKIRGL
jgi:N-acetylglucosaminyldiphosphoundecaprenol N-acetyl-beta-D-mannosaminyltransferase